MTTKWILLLGIVLLFLVVFYSLSKNNLIGCSWLSVAYAILFMIVFDFSEKVNFVQQVDNPFNWRIPLSTLFISMALLFNLFTILTEKKVLIDFNPCTKYFTVACAFLLAISLLFFPLLAHRYEMGIDADIHLMNNIAKYLTILYLVPLHVDRTEKLKRLNALFLASIGITLSLSLML